MKLKSLKSLMTTAVLGLASTAASATSVWQIDKGEDTVYLGGTVHILPASEFPLPKTFMDVYGKTDSIVLEAKLPDPTDQAAQMAMMQALSLPPGQSLSTLLSESTYAELKAYFASIGMDLAQFERFKPGFVVPLMVVIEAQRHNMAGDGVDAFFSKKAKQDGKPAEYLETMEFQLNLLAQQGKGEEDHLVKTSLDYIPEFKPLLEKLIAAWRSGDEKTLVDLVVNRMKEESPKGFKTMMIDRNKDWVPKIENMFGDDDKEFVLVGVGHLVGEDNVIELLKEKGYKVTKLN